ncbi:MAG: DNA repair exonuclease [Bacteroidetes bacterium]|nr:MAG: DNA repair exonuclease [Bacteroidota bacterium]
MASRLKDATLKSFQRIIDLCIEQKVDFLLVSGDVFDSEMKSLAAQLRFVKELERLNQQGIPAYIIAGNHDPRHSWMKELKLPLQSYLFGADTAEYITFEKEGERLADIYGVSYATQNEKRDLDGFYTRRGNPAPFSIALLHGTIGAAGPHENYVPFRLEEIRGKGFDYWALGHIHKHRVVHPAYPAVVYPGNPQGRDFGETGPRGCYMVELRENSAPHLAFVPLQTIRFEEVTVDLNGVEDISQLHAAIEQAIREAAGSSEQESYMLRIRLTGRTRLHGLLHKPGEVNHLLQLLNEGQLQQTYFTWIDRIELHTLPDTDLELLKKGNDFIAELLAVFDAMEADPAQLEAVISSADKEFSSLQARKEINELSAEEKKEITEQARWMLLDPLLKEEQ